MSIVRNRTIERRDSSITLKLRTVPLSKNRAVPFSISVSCPFVEIRTVLLFSITVTRKEERRKGTDYKLTSPAYIGKDVPLTLSSKSAIKPIGCDCQELSSHLEERTTIVIES